jgi:hypothetical protein
MKRGSDEIRWFSGTCLHVLGPASAIPKSESFITANDVILQGEESKQLDMRNTEDWPLDQDPSYPTMMGEVCTIQIQLEAQA